MNVRVEAGSLILGVTASIVEPTTKVEIKVIPNQTLCSKWTCFTLPSISVNGHSISAINPEATLIGGMATLAMA